MASRLLTNTIARARPLGQRGFATKQQFPEESFNGNAWRNALIVAVAGVAWYRIDQHVTGLGDEKHPFTKWIEYHMPTFEDKENTKSSALDAASKVAEYRLLTQDAQRAPIYRMRYPESFERHSPRGYTAGTQVDLSDLKIRSD